MASLDSDSSDAEESNYTETNVLLGYASKEPTDDSISQLGGRPTWLDPDVPPSAALARCKVCSAYLTLLLELNGDLPDRYPGHERRLYIFSCRRKACRRKQGCIRAIRGVRASKMEQKKGPRGTRTKDDDTAKDQAARINVGDDLFGSKPTASKALANPFSQSGSTPGTANPFSQPVIASQEATASPFSQDHSSAPAPTSSTSQPSDTLEAAPPTSASSASPSSASITDTFASKLSISENPLDREPLTPPSPPESWPSESSLPPAYPAYYLDADYETLSPTASPTSASANPSDISTDEPASRTADDSFESSLDKPFLRFADRLAQNPLQVLRYEFRGTPLLYSHSDEVGKALAPHQAHHHNYQGQAESKITTIRAARTGAGAGNSGGGGGIPPCANCGAARVFELQLTPQAIAELEAEEEGVDGMDWGTVILGVCGQDCVPRQSSGRDGPAADAGSTTVGYVEEWVGVQWEEVGGKR